MITLPRGGSAPGHLLPILIVVALAGGCAAKRLRVEVDAGLARADREVAAGCYRCLTQALGIYMALAPRDPQQRAAVDQRRFRTSILLALREKELGLGATSHLERARQLVARQRDAAIAQERLKFVELMPWDPAGLPRDKAEAQLPRFFEPIQRIAARIADRTSSADPDLDAYITVSLACHRGQAPGENVAAVAKRLPASASVGFLVAACTGDLRGLRDVIAREPRFVEAQLFIGRHLAGIPRAGRRPITAIVPRATTREGRVALEAALQAFPDSPAIAMDLAVLMQRSDYKKAFELFERVTSRVPTHHDAWFGTGVALSFLKRHDAAVAAMTRVLDLGRWHVGDAYYWRAWNHHQARDLERAWADVEEAKKTLYNTDLFALAGFIAYDRQQLDVARTNLEKAVELSALNCAATWYLGLVHSAETRWPVAASSFESAAACYRSDIALARTQKAQAEASDHPVETKAALIAEADETIRDAERQEATASYNAAFAHVNGGERTKARPLLERALQHDDMKARATELLSFLDK